MSDNQTTGRADLHMHTTASDGLPTPQELLDFVARRGDLDVIAITDHDCLDGSLWAYEQRHNYPFDIVPGMEVTTAGGHVLALWVHQLIPRGLSLRETVAAIHEAGGLAVLAHPFEMLLVATSAIQYLRRPQIVVAAGIDAIEIHNAGTLTPAANRMARRLASRQGLTVSGGSDAHALESIGCGVTRFAGRGAADLRRALEAGQTRAEGRSWPLRVYSKVILTSPQRLHNRMTQERNRSERPTTL